MVRSSFDFAQDERVLLKAHPERSRRTSRTLRNWPARRSRISGAGALSGMTGRCWATRRQAAWANPRNGKALPVHRSRTVSSAPRPAPRGRAHPERSRRIKRCKARAVPPHHPAKTHGRCHHDHRPAMRHSRLLRRSRQTSRRVVPRLTQPMNTSVSRQSHCQMVSGRSMGAER